MALFDKSHIDRRCTVTMTTSCIVSETKQIVRNRDFYHHCIWSPR